MRFSRQLLVALSAGAAFVVAGCSSQDMRSFEGLAAGDYLRVGAPLSGNLASLKVRPGERVKPGEALFTLDSAESVAANRGAQQRLEAARLKLKAAQRSGDANAVAAARDDVAVAESAVAEADWRLEQMQPTAPRDAVVVDTLYSEGQWVPAGAPVVALMAPEAMKVRFYVPARVVGTLHHGQSLQLRCAACKGGIRATISYISPLAESGKPADGNAAPRFLVEATPLPDSGLALRPGNPVKVLL